MAIERHCLYRHTYSIDNFIADYSSAYCGLRQYCWHPRWPGGIYSWLGSYRKRQVHQGSLRNPGHLLMYLGGKMESYLGVVGPFRIQEPLALREIDQVSVFVLCDIGMFEPRKVF